MDSVTRSYRWLWANPLTLGCTAIMACLSVACSIFDGKGRLQHSCARTWARFILKVSGAIVTVEGIENVPTDRPCILVSNHQSFFDIWSLLAILPIQFRFAAKDSLFRLPFLGWHLRRSGNIPIHRGDPRKSLRSLRDAGRRIDAGISVLMFPEGGRSEDGVIRPFKKGVFLLATYCSAPMVPITIIGSRELLPKGGSRIRSGRIHVVISPPVETAGITATSMDDLMEKVREAITGPYRPAV